MSLLSEGGDKGGNGGNGTGTGSGASSSGGGTGSGGSSGGTGSGTSSSTSWRDSLPDDIKSDSSLAVFNDVPSLAKAFIHTKSQVGKKGVVLPGEKATDDDYRAFWKELGQPDLDKFEVKTPEGREVSEDLVKAFKESAHKVGLLPKQAQGLLDWFTEFEEKSMSSQIEAINAEAKEQHDSLRKEWGQGYDKEISKARLAVKEVGGQELAEYLESTGLGNDVQIVKFMAKVGALLGEDKLRGSAGGGFGKTPAEVQKEIDQMRGDPKSPYFDAAHPGHKAAVQRMEELYRQQAS